MSGDSLGQPPPPERERPAGQGRADLFENTSSAKNTTGRVAVQGVAEILPPVPGFDYSGLDPEIAALVQDAAFSIKSTKRRAIVRVGTQLERVQKRLPYGQWGAWLKAEFGWTQRTALNYIGAADLILGCEKFSKLQSTTLYLLAAPSTPEPVRQEITDRFNAGEVIPDHVVKEMVETAKYQQQEEKRRGAHKPHKREERDANAVAVAKIFAKRLRPEELQRIAEMLVNNALYLHDAIKKAAQLIETSTSGEVAK
jgi:hypothetical protein